MWRQSSASRGRADNCWLLLELLRRARASRAPMGGPGSGRKKQHDGPTRREKEAARKAAAAAEKKRKRDDVLHGDERKAAAAAMSAQELQHFEEQFGANHPQVQLLKRVSGIKDAGSRRSGRVKEVEYAAVAAEVAAEAAAAAQPKPNSIKAFFTKA